MDWIMVAGKSSGGAFIPITGWRTTDGVVMCRSYGEMRCKVGTLTVYIYAQYTNDLRSPAGQTVIGGSVNADGMLDPTTANDLTATLAGYRYVRFGYWTVGDNTNIAVAFMAGAVIIKPS